MKEYGIYDVKDNEQCLYIGNINEIAQFLDCSNDSLRSYLTRKKNGEQDLLHRRYELIEISDEEEKEEYPQKKSSQEIWQEIIKEFSGLDEILTLEELIAKFEVFDKFKWTLKGIVDKVIVDEEWKNIPGFNYSLSNYGRVRNDKNGKLMRLRYHKWRIQTEIYKDGVKYTINVPRLEANLFIRKIEEEERVTFHDGDKRNTYYKNLKIVSK